MGLGVTPGSGAVVASDSVASEHVQRIKVTFGVTDSATPVSSTAPLPVREPVNGSALSKGGGTVTAATSVLVATNASRSSIEVSNSSNSGIWLAFGSAAVAGQGTYLPSKATGVWATTAAVNMILESGGTGGVIGFTEW